MKAFKRNAVIIVVLLFVCVAVYLNYSYNKGQDLSVAGEVAESKSDDSDSEDSNNSTDEETADLENAEDGEDSEDSEEDSSDSSSLYYKDSSSSSADYFSEARLTRQQARDSATALLQEAAAVSNASQEQIDNAVASISVMANYSVTEAKIENNLIAKDFEDCVVFISDGAVNVTISAPEGGLTDADVAQITETVLNEIDVGTDQIKVVEIN